MTFRASKGVHHQAYGGNAYLDAGVAGGIRFTGTYRDALTSSSVRVSRQTNDEDVDQVWVRLWSEGPAELMLPAISRSRLLSSQGRRKQRASGLTAVAV